MKRAAGISTDMHDYSFFDANPPKQTVYYRLKQVDLNDGFGFSTIKAVNPQVDVTTTEVAYLIYPNPASDYLVINGSAFGNKDVVIELRIALEALVLLNPFPGAAVQKQINLDGIPSSLYTLEIKNAGLRPAFFKIQVSK
ncbi:MAG: hypothetical protein JST18_07725 [Bacteroidetes bacterium]|nr:hypothetical protein [Bacteroidota bacterium]